MKPESRDWSAGILVVIQSSLYLFMNFASNVSLSGHPANLSSSENWGVGETRELIPLTAVACFCGGVRSTLPCGGPGPARPGPAAATPQTPDVFSPRSLRRWRSLGAVLESSLRVSVFPLDCDEQTGEKQAAFYSCFCCQYLAWCLAPYRYLINAVWINEKHAQETQATVWSWLAG